MKKNIQENQNHGVNKNLGLLIIGLFLVITVFGGLTLNKLDKQNKDLQANQFKLESQIASLQNDVTTHENKINDLNDNLAQEQKDLTSYKKLAYSLQKKIDDNTVAQQNAATIIPAVATKTITKKVTQKVYVDAPAKHQTSVTVQGVGSYQVDVVSGDNAFTSLQKAAKIGGFPIDYQTYSFGVFVTSIGNTKPAANEYWAFYYNGNFSNVGASDQKISDNDTTFWRLESF